MSRNQLEKEINYLEKNKLDETSEIKYHNSNWSQILDHSYRILVTGCSGSRKMNAILKQQDSDDYSIIDKINILLKTQINWS